VGGAGNLPGEITASTRAATRPPARTRSGRAASARRSRSGALARGSSSYFDLKPGALIVYGRKVAVRGSSTHTTGRPEGVGRPLVLVGSNAHHGL
jgi:hypothetical protein